MSQGHTGLCRKSWWASSCGCVRRARRKGLHLGDELEHRLVPPGGVLVGAPLHDGGDGVAAVLERLLPGENEVQHPADRVDLVDGAVRLQALELRIADRALQLGLRQGEVRLRFF